VVTVLGYRSRGPGSIPGAIRFLERGPLSLVSTIEELLERRISRSGLENQDYGRRGSAAQKLPLTSSRSGGHSVGIVRSRTEATEEKREVRCLSFAYPAPAEFGFYIRTHTFPLT
jgi:hypothetical protein